MVLTNHHSLEYLQMACQLKSPPSTMGSLLESPIIQGAKNVKADTLSPPFYEEAQDEPESILPPNVIVS